MTVSVATLVGALFLLTVNADVCTQNLKDNPPNVLFYLVDDLGWNDISWNNPEINTPNLHVAAMDGIILDQNYAMPVCSPSRGALHAGKFANRIGMQHSVIMADVPECLAPSYKTLPEELKDIGYATHLIGKWHLGFCDKACTPTYRGYDTFYGFYNGVQDHYEHTFYGGYEFYDGEQNINVTGQYTQTLFNTRAREIIANHDASTPMFMLYSNDIPHDPLQTEDHSQYDHPRDTYLAMVESMDRDFASIVQALKDAGLYDNTVIIFSSDNGGQAGPWGHGGPAWASNAPLRGGKGSVWEGSTRSVGFVHSPLQTMTNVRSMGMVHIVDWYPTILDMAGACPTTDVDGVSQVDLILNNGPSARDRFVYNIDQYFPYPFGKGSVRLGDYKLVRGYPGNYDGYHSDGYVGATYKFDPCNVDHLPDSDFDIDPSWNKMLKYAKKSEDCTLLYNVIDDPEERTDLAAAMPEKVAELQAVLDYYASKSVDIDLQHLMPVPEARNYGGIWAPGWCPGYY